MGGFGSMLEGEYLSHRRNESSNLCVRAESDPAFLKDSHCGTEDCLQSQVDRKLDTSKSADSATRLQYAAQIAKLSQAQAA